VVCQGVFESFLKKIAVFQNLPEMEKTGNPQNKK
jgi:hypothetical protein